MALAHLCILKWHEIGALINHDPLMRLCQISLLFRSFKEVIYKNFCIVGLNSF